MPEADRDTRLQVAALGAAVKVERRRQGLSVQQLSRRSGLSSGLISELERGQGNPSFGSLNRLARALGVALPKLVSGLGGDEMVVRADQRYPLPGSHDGASAVRELLTPRMQSHLQVIRSELPVGFSNEGSPFRHLGTEFVLVERGRLLVAHGRRRVELGPEDAMTYGCSTPHWWANADDDVTVVLGSVTPLEV